jgi:hypothetical protein
MRWLFRASPLLVVATTLLSGCWGDGGTRSTDDATVRVPRVLGERSNAAARELRRLGLRPSFTVLGTPSSTGRAVRPCAGLPLHGHIVDQDLAPFGGAFRVHKGRRVGLQASCPPREELAACPLSELQLRTDFLAPGMGTGNVYLRGKLRHAHGPPCAATGLLELAVETSDGSLVEMPGNPGSTRMDRTAGPGETLMAQFDWQKWCGPGRHFVFVVRYETLHVTQHVPAARCEGDVPSALTPPTVITADNRPGWYWSALPSSSAG